MMIFTPEMLAKRWHCSPRKIYYMVQAGELASFRLGGKLVRIKEEEVIRWENQTPPLAGSTANSMRDGQTNMESIGATASAQVIRQRLRLHSLSSTERKTHINT